MVVRGQEGAHRHGRWPWWILALVAAGGVVAIAADRPGLDSRRAYLFEANDRLWLSTSMALGMLQDPYSEVRGVAARVLAANPDPARLRLVSEYAGDVSPRVREQAMLAAGRMGEVAAAVAVRGLRDRSAAVRQGAVWAASHAGDEAYEPVSKLLLTEESPEVLTTAISNLWRFEGRPWEALAARFAGHDDPNLRRAAASALARSSARDRFPALATLARDAEPVIRATAVAGYRQGELTPAQQKVLEESLADADWRVQAAACDVLAARPELRLSASAGQRLASLWTGDRAQLTALALRAGGLHPEAGKIPDLRQMADHGDPWLAAEAFVATARRGSPGVAELAKTWLASDELWRRRAAARSVIHLPTEPRAELEAAALEDSSAAVRLALLDSWNSQAADARQGVLKKIVDTDPDAPVRAHALALLHSSGKPVDPDRMRSLYRRWQEDDVPDARAAALAAAVQASRDKKTRDKLFGLAAEDPDPAIAAMVYAEARQPGDSEVLPERENRHGKKWYRDLVQWSDQDHWLDVVTVRGTFRVRLDSRETPITCREIAGLAHEGFYDGLIFHRVVPNFVVQGGDPRGDGRGGPGFTLPDEPTLRPFDSWRVGIATSGPNTGGSQFFVTLFPVDRLTGHYTNFGEVVAGRDVLTRIQAGDQILRMVEVQGDEPLAAPLPTDTAFEESK